jgi:hypothetical protein
VNESVQLQIERLAAVCIQSRIRPQAVVNALLNAMRAKWDRLLYQVPGAIIVRRA